MSRVGRAARTEQLIKNVGRLRRAERLAPSCAQDIAAVRRDLEAEVGPTLSRSMAARVLGVSQTALDRWIASGDIPTVIAPSGRDEVPRHVVVELADEIEELRRRGALRHPLASALHRRRTEPLDLASLSTTRQGAGAVPRDHETAELAALAYHRAIAQRLDDELVRMARERIDRWRRDGRIHPAHAQRWETLLAEPLPRIAAAITQETPDARDLRQSSPFAGVLSEHERRRLLEAIR